MLLLYPKHLHAPINVQRMRTMDYDEKYPLFTIKISCSQSPMKRNKKIYKIYT